MISSIEQNMESIRDLCRRYGVMRLEVFGSATDDTFDSARSDIDFLFEFTQGYDFGPWMERFLDLKDEFSK